MSFRMLVLASAFVALPALATTPINETRPLAATGQVSIDNVKGRIVVRTWDRPEVQVRGQLGEGVEKLEVSGSAEALRIEVRYPQSQGGWFGWGGGGDAGESLLDVTLPRTASVEVSAVSADVDVSGVAGRWLQLESVSGDVRVRDSRPGQAQVESVSGDLDLELDSRDTSVDSVSGDVQLRGALQGEVRIETVSGNASLVAQTLDELRLSTVSGDGRLQAGLAPAGSLRADSVSGQLGLVLPADTSARLRLESFSGRISSPVGTVVTEKYGPGSHLDARLGSGSADIRVESFSGDIQVNVSK